MVETGVDVDEAAQTLAKLARWQTAAAAAAALFAISLWQPGWAAFELDVDDVLCRFVFGEEDNNGDIEGDELLLELLTKQFCWLEFELVGALFEQQLFDEGTVELFVPVGVFAAAATTAAAAACM